MTIDAQIQLATYFADPGRWLAVPKCTKPRKRTSATLVCAQNSPERDMSIVEPFARTAPLARQSGEDYKPATLSIPMGFRKNAGLPRLVIVLVRSHARGFLLVPSNIRFAFAVGIRSALLTAALQLMGSNTDVALPVALPLSLVPRSV